jgi:hypothetical protein
MSGPHTVPYQHTGHTRISPLFVCLFVGLLLLWFQQRGVSTHLESIQIRHKRHPFYGSSPFFFLSLSTSLVVVVSQIYPGPFDFFNSSRKKKKKKRVAFVHGPNNTSPFPPLGVVWCVGGSSSSIIPAQFLYRTPPVWRQRETCKRKRRKKRAVEVGIWSMESNID